ncbi:polyadenylate-binding protein 2-binding protein [Perilla frutescens var. frutescens]|nr:polyadenylate-binding protein 2-binding protein [Perilla frutescens var. frutescens]
MVFSIVNQQTLFSAVNICSFQHSLSLLSPKRAKLSTSYTSFVSHPSHIVKRLSCNAALGKSDSNTESSPSNNPKLKRKGKSGRQTSKQPENEGEKPEGSFPGIIPKKPRRGRRSEAAAVEDYVRNSLEQTLESIRNQNPEIMENMQNFMKEKTASDDDTSDDEDDDEDSGSGGAKKMVVEEEDPDWPLDTDVGWGIRASEYFDQHPIKNVVGEDGTEIDWEGEIDYGFVKEINCLEWESFAFHPSPLIVLVFERYNRASDNWRALKELEKAADVYWKAKDRLPPRTVKVDINIEKDLAYALKVREGPELLFLRGNKILYREKDIRSADELVQMIAYFYYNAKKPSCINDAALSSLH